MICRNTNNLDLIEENIKDIFFEKQYEIDSSFISSASDIVWSASLVLMAKNSDIISFIIYLHLLFDI